MKTARLFNLGLASASLVLAGAGDLATAAPPRGPLTVHPGNPRYFARPDGRAVWLTGLHPWAAVQERGFEGQTPDSDFPRQLDCLEQDGHNFILINPGLHELRDSICPSLQNPGSSSVQWIV